MACKKPKNSNCNPKIIKIEILNTTDKELKSGVVFEGAIVQERDVSIKTLMDLMQTVVQQNKEILNNQTLIFKRIDILEKDMTTVKKDIKDLKIRVTNIEKEIVRIKKDNNLI